MADTDSPPDPGDRDARSVDANAAEMMRGGHVPGLVMAIVARDRVLHLAAHGLADVAAGRPVVPATDFLWFSMTKIVTATAALRMADESTLDLDAPVDRYVPHLRTRRTRQPLVRQLLDHTAGLANPAPIRWVHPAGSPGPDPAEFLARLLARRSAAPREPGRQARYSNLGYLMLAQVIAAAAGGPFEDHIVRSVLGPAGMHRTGFAYRPGADRAIGYVRAPLPAGALLRAVLPRGIVGARHGAHVSLRPFLVDGAGYGGLVGAVGDAARFLRLHLRDGEIDGNRIITPATARAMRRITARGDRFDHALGWFRERGTDGRDHVEHFGAGAGFWNVMRIYPDRGIGVVLMANTTARYRFEPLLDDIARNWSTADDATTS